jgi:thiol-disulfide isomerase/thioredoxin
MTTTVHITLFVALGLFVFAMGGCTPSPKPEPDAATIPPKTKEWMDRLTVRTEYDPKTGFIVAREVIALPAALRDAPLLPEALESSRRSGKPVLVFATADRCGPCQQYKKDALNDPRVVAWMGEGRAHVAHVEVDRQPDAAALLPSAAIPMTYWMMNGRVAGELRGQRSADELLAFVRGRS